MKQDQLTLICQRFAMVLTIALLLFVNSLNPVMAEEQILQTLTVTGQGKESIPTTLSLVELGVEVQGKTATNVQQEVAQRTNKVLDTLKAKNVEKLKTTGIRLQPNYRYDNNNVRSLIGYIGTNTVSFRLPTDKVGSLLDDAVKAGATRIDRVSFTATEEAISTAQKEALRLATMDAQQQAEAVLDALNFTAKEIITIQVGGANVPQPNMIQAEAMVRSASSSTTPVVGGQQNVQGFVTLQIRY